MELFAASATEILKYCYLLLKVEAFRKHYYYLQQNSNAFYGRPFREPMRGNSDFALTIWRF